MAPVVLTVMGKGCVPEDHPLVLGQCGMHGKRVSNWALSNADLIIAVGTRFSDRITGNPCEFAKEATIIHIDIDSSEIGKNVKTDIGLVGDAKEALGMICAALKGRPGSAWTDRVRELREACTCDLDRDEKPIKPQRIIYELSKNLPDRSIITTEVGQNQMWVTHFYPISRGETIITSGGLGTMGFGLPAAIGAKVGQPDRTVVDVAGDGSFFMNCHELSCAVEEDLPVVVALMNNGWLGMVKQWQKLFFEKRYHMTKLGNKTDFVKVAHGFGAEGNRIDDPRELGEAIRQATRSGKPFVLDIVTDPEEDILPMVPPGGKINEMIGGTCSWK
jgi:acetolactate synthase-1/2/3 large subunit